jgi:hypothetical protein
VASVINWDIVRSPPWRGVRTPSRPFEQLFHCCFIDQRIIARPTIDIQVNFPEWVLTALVILGHNFPP